MDKRFRNRIASVPQHIFQIRSDELSLGEWRQFQNGDPASERFADITHQSELSIILGQIGAMADDLDTLLYAISEEDVMPVGAAMGLSRILDTCRAALNFHRLEANTEGGAA